MFDNFDSSTHVVISRHWKNPEITVSVNHEKITVLATMEAFIDALLLEMKPPFMTGLWQRIKNQHPSDAEIKHAAIQVIEKIKDATSQAM